MIIALTQSIVAISIDVRRLVKVGKPWRLSDLVVVSPFRKNGPGLLELMAKEIETGQCIDRTLR